MSSNESKPTNSPLMHTVALDSPNKTHEALMEDKGGVKISPIPSTLSPSAAVANGDLISLDKPIFSSSTPTHALSSNPVPTRTDIHNNAFVHSSSIDGTQTPVSVGDPGDARHCSFSPTVSHSAMTPHPSTPPSTNHTPTADANSVSAMSSTPVVTPSVVNTDVYGGCDSGSGGDCSGSGNDGTHGNTAKTCLIPEELEDSIQIPEKLSIPEKSSGSMFAVRPSPTSSLLPLAPVLSSPSTASHTSSSSLPFPSLSASSSACALPCPPLSTRASAAADIAALPLPSPLSPSLSPSSALCPPSPASSSSSSSSSLPPLSRSSTSTSTQREGVTQRTLHAKHTHSPYTASHPPSHSHTASHSPYTASHSHITPLPLRARWYTATTSLTLLSFTCFTILLAITDAPLPQIPGKFPGLSEIPKLIPENVYHFLRTPLFSTHSFFPSFSTHLSFEVTIMLLLLLLAPFSHLLGILRYSEYRAFQPFSGGRVYVFLQALAWTAYGAGCMLALATAWYGVRGAARVLLRGAGVGGLLAQLLVLISIHYFTQSAIERDSGHSHAHAHAHAHRHEEDDDDEEEEYDGNQDKRKTEPEQERKQVGKEDMTQDKYGVAEEPREMSQGEAERTTVAPRLSASSSADVEPSHDMRHGVRDGMRHASSSLPTQTSTSTSTFTSTSTSAPVSHLHTPALQPSPHSPLSPETHPLPSLIPAVEDMVAGPVETGAGASSCSGVVKTTQKTRAKVKLNIDPNAGANAEAGAADEVEVEAEVEVDVDVDVDVDADASVPSPLSDEVSAAEAKAKSLTVSPALSMSCLSPPVAPHPPHTHALRNVRVPGGLTLLLRRLDWRSVGAVSTALTVLSLVIAVVIESQALALAPSSRLALGLCALAAVVIAVPTTHVVAGPKLHNRGKRRAERHYRCWQPCLGGRRFVLLQALGWGLWAIALLLGAAVAFCSLMAQMHTHTYLQAQTPMHLPTDGYSLPQSFPHVSTHIPMHTQTEDQKPWQAHEQMNTDVHTPTQEQEHEQQQKEASLSTTTSAPSSFPPWLHVAPRAVRVILCALGIVPDVHMHDTQQYPHSATDSATASAHTSYPWSLSNTLIQTATSLHGLVTFSGVVAVVAQLLVLASLSQFDQSLAPTIPITHPEKQVFSGKPKIPGGKSSELFSPLVSASSQSAHITGTHCHPSPLAPSSSFSLSLYSLRLQLSMWSPLSSLSHLTDLFWVSFIYHTPLLGTAFSFFPFIAWYNWGLVTPSGLLVLTAYILYGLPLILSSAHTTGALSWRAWRDPSFPLWPALIRYFRGEVKVPTVADIADAHAACVGAVRLMASGVTVGEYDRVLLGAYSSSTIHEDAATHIDGSVHIEAPAPSAPSSYANVPARVATQTPTTQTQTEPLSATAIANNTSATSTSATQTTTSSSRAGSRRPSASSTTSATTIAAVNANATSTSLLPALHPDFTCLNPHLAPFPSPPPSLLARLQREDTVMPARHAPALFSMHPHGIYPLTAFWVTKHDNFVKTFGWAEKEGYQVVISPENSHAVAQSATQSLSSHPDSVATTITTHTMTKEKHQHQHRTHEDKKNDLPSSFTSSSSSSSSSSLFKLRLPAYPVSTSDRHTPTRTNSNTSGGNGNSVKPNSDDADKEGAAPTTDTSDTSSTSTSTSSSHSQSLMALPLLTITPSSTHSLLSSSSALASTLVSLPIASLRLRHPMLSPTLLAHHRKHPLPPLPRHPGELVDILGASALPKCAVMREVFLWSGGRDVTRTSIYNCLAQRRSCLLIAGGQKEMSYARPHDRNLTLYTRHAGFVRLALQCGAPLVPLLSFGENQLLSTFEWEAFQQFVYKHTRIFLPLFPHGRWFSTVPYRIKVGVVIGTPLYMPQIDDPDEATVAFFHAVYYAKVRELFFKYRDEQGYADAKLIYI